MPYNWVRPSRCDSGACVMATVSSGNMVLRDTKGGTVTYTPEEWEEFLIAVRAGQYDFVDVETLTNIPLWHDDLNAIMEDPEVFAGE